MLALARLSDNFSFPFFCVEAIVDFKMKHVAQCVLLPEFPHSSCINPKNTVFFFLFLLLLLFCFVFVLMLGSSYTHATHIQQKTKKKKLVG